MDNFYTAIDILEKQARTNGRHKIYNFLTYKEETDSWDMESHTFLETWHRSLALANDLRRKGLVPGDRAVIFSMQDFGTICGVFGCMMAGVTFTIIPPPLDEDKTQRFIAVLRSCRPRALISNYAMESASGVHVTGRLLKDAFRETIQLKRVYTDRLTPYHRRDVIVGAAPENLVYLQYTSGSTSAPKGVRVTWKNLMKNLEQCYHCLNLKDVSLATWVPFFHNLGLEVTICMPLFSQNSFCYYLQTLQFLENPKLWIRMIKDFHITLTVGPASAYDACTRIYTEAEAAEYAMPQVTHFMNGSEFISAAPCARFQEMFQCSPNAMAPGYGLAEAVCLATFAAQDYRSLRLDYAAYQKNRAVIAPPDCENVKEIVSVGAPVKDLLVVIGNPKTGKVYPDMRIGEIFLSGESVADGYWENPRESRNFHVHLQGYDCEFYKTGDLGFLCDGHLYITGRVKEMLVVNGNNIYPSDLAAVTARRVPALAGASYGFFSCLTGSGEVVIAAIETKPGANYAKLAQQISRAAADRFGFSYYDIVFVPEGTIPRTDNRKLQMLKVRTLYEKQELDILYSSRTAPAQDTADGTDSAVEKEIELLIDRADDIFLQVKGVFQKVLNLDTFSLSASFLELGGDSLTGFELINSIEQKFHVRLDLRELLKDSSVIGVTKYLHRVLAGGPASVKKINLAAECRLEDSIEPSRDYEKAPTECRKIFLTGATGFLGARLICAILRDFPHDGLEIYCLVRAASPAEGMKRMKANLQRYRLWDDRMKRYLRAVPGDLSAPKLGLYDEVWENLAEHIEMIYHAGAILNFVYPYEYLKQTNVNGTTETLRLACAGRPKYYNYVSSYSVYDTPNNRGKRVMEDDPLRSWKGFPLAYSETKWVSEKLVGIAADRGLRTAVYRPGDITGAADGIWQMDDMVSRLIVSMIQMHAVPFVNYRFHMTPVDYVGNALVYISLKDEAYGHAFNLITPHPQNFNSVVNAVRACGYTVHRMPATLWLMLLKKSSASENAMALLECLFEEGSESNPNVMGHFLGKDPLYDRSNTRLLLGRSGIQCPPVDQERIAAYLRYFRAKGYIE